MDFSSSKSNEKKDHRSDLKTLNLYNEIISTLPKRKGWKSGEFYHYQGFWHTFFYLEGLLSAQQHFKPQTNDIIVSSFPKTGTTWLKALSFAIMTRSSFDISASPLLTTTPHECVLSLEGALAHNSFHRNQDIPLIGTHVPYTSLPKSIIDSGCKIIYICRDPKDTFVSLWQFARNANLKGVDSSTNEVAELEKAFELFCDGVTVYGPYWDHVLGYWKASLESPERILFLKFEDLKKEALFYVKKIAEFMGYPFSLEEEEKGMVQKIVDLCSFQNLSELEVNKSGHLHGYLFEKKLFFRKGETGDWKNHLTPTMATRLDQITEQKLRSFGLKFNA
ncbi:flavonol sulfotransferase-like [Quercus suber]|uniref:flavonol sulfotransferase-like n=1 Tax=Quercus suber TaxID=58331 RepID=UPI000CE28229|nr:flavonol sulfotransferase-like [Quercus suber]